MTGLHLKQLVSALGLLSRVLLLGAVCIARADDSAPAAVDDHAAYCIPVIQSQIQQQHSMLDALDKKLKDPSTPAELRKQIDAMEVDARQQLAPVENNIKRMRAAVQAHPDDSKRDAHAAAQEQGAHDIDEFNAMLKRCSGKCYAAGAFINKCEDECQDKKLLARVKSCFAPAWLP